MPSGRLPRIWSTEFLTSFNPSIVSVPISNSTKVLEEPSLAVELMFLTPLIERTAASIRWVIWFSISVGAAPGWDMVICTAGKSMSG